jgi:Na+-transporting methylmalonyl-CoA/oxaloacetate decarboxylase beta subunit
MPEFQILDLFQGIATLAASEPKILFARIFLILLGFALIYLGRKGVLEALLMIPMGLGMAAVNAGVMFFEGDRMGTLFLDPLVSETGPLVDILQINWLQFLGLLLGVLCEAETILDPTVLILLILGMTALLFSALGGLVGGYILYFLSGRKYNPTIVIAAVSCVPTTAKVVQKEVSAINPEEIVLPHALGANVCGVITSAEFAALLITLLRPH